MKYLHKAFEYCELYKNTKNRKLIREFLAFLEDNNIPLCDSAEAIVEFTREPFFAEKKRTTQKNYLRDLKHFVKYVYESEGYCLHPSFMGRESYKEEEIVESSPISESQERRIVDKEEYYDFLHRYNKIVAREREESI